MAITPKQEENLQDFEAELTVEGERLSPEQITAIGSRVLKGKKLQDGLRAAVYIENLHQHDKRDPEWDKLLSVKDFMNTFRENLA